MVAVRDEQLELERLEVIGGNARAGKAVENNEKGVHLAQVPEELRTRSGDVDDADGGRGDLPRAHGPGEPIETLVRDLRHSDVLLARAVRLGARQSAEERRLP